LISIDSAKLNKILENEDDERSTNNIEEIVIEDK